MANKRGRPRKMGLDWFPFDVTLLTDRKLRRPRAEFGSAAVLTSRRIQRTYYNAVSRRKCACIDWDIWLLSEDEMREIKPSHEILSAYLKRQSHGDISATLSPINAEKNTQSRVEKSRVE